MPFKVGDPVKVKEQIVCPDDESLCIGGWQGRITDIGDGDIVEISWDSVTLKQLPEEYIRQSETEGLDWTQMCLSVDEIELASPRDSEAQAVAVAEKIENKVQWVDRGKEGERIAKVIANTDDIEDEIEAWNNHLMQVLVFPFEAKVSEVQERGPLNYGDRIRVQGIVETDDLYGILVDVQYGRKHFAFPLCDLTVRDKKSQNYTPIQDYCVWFANR
jgi:hypothetical protein